MKQTEMKVLTLTTEQADHAIALIYRYLKRHHDFTNKSKDRRYLKWYAGPHTQGLGRLRRELTQARIPFQIKPTVGSGPSATPGSFRIYVPLDYTAPPYKKPTKAKFAKLPSTFDTPPQPKTFIWEGVTRDTDRLKVGGGYLYRTTVYGNSETAPPTVAMVLVPDAGLTARLIHYVSADDVNLPDREFFRLVADRINDDLA